MVRRGLFMAPGLPWSGIEGDPAGLLPCVTWGRDSHRPVHAVRLCQGRG